MRLRTHSPQIILLVSLAKFLRRQQQMDRAAITGTLSQRLTIGAKSRLGQLWSIMHQNSGAGGGRVCILIYHSIGDEVCSITPAAFDNQMWYLSQHTTVMPLEHLLSPELPASARPTCVITFDDGYASVYHRALPILKRYHFHASLYLTTGLVGEQTPLMSDPDPGLFPSLAMLTWKQIRELQRERFTIGTHLVHHKDLTALGHEEAVAELESSRSAIEQHTNGECLDFAYPWGRANQNCARYVREAGYRSAVTALHRAVPPNCDPMFIPRIDIRRGYNLAHFRSIVSGDWDYLGVYQEFKHALQAIGRD
jgi:peptidoglycan/xylan/chitin deacetylase (PgdA/CDA1 family)